MIYEYGSFGTMGEPKVGTREEVVDYINNSLNDSNISNPAFGETILQHLEQAWKQANDAGATKILITIDLDGGSWLQFDLHE